MKRVTLILVLSFFVPQFSMAETLESACNRSPRAASGRVLCGCIQEVANLTLTSGDQRMAVKIFKDPQKAQEIRQSDQTSHEKFWGRYKKFASAARQLCGKKSS
ncbi:MAG: hypothetical protein ACU0CA_15220 [Paracoccaceae bacterium]